MCHQQDQLPCLHCQPHEYIRMVQHLIERCLLFHMGRDECAKALSRHAKIDPIVTLTVWRELLKENRGFFEAYFHASSSSSSSSSSNPTSSPVQRYPNSEEQNTENEMNADCGFSHFSNKHSI